MTEDDIITMMVGREITSLYPHELMKSKMKFYEKISAWHPINTHIKRVDNVSFSLQEGKFLGVAGLVVQVVQTWCNAYLGLMKVC